MPSSLFHMHDQPAETSSAIRFPQQFHLIHHIQIKAGQSMLHAW